jgi:hypothetical protein
VLSCSAVKVERCLVLLCDALRETYLYDRVMMPTTVDSASRPMVVCWSLSACVSS